MMKKANKIDTQVLLFPSNWKVLSGSWLKVIAMLSMLIDHLAAWLFRYYDQFQYPLLLIGHKQITLTYLMRCTGRLAFPIFAFLLVEGFRYTHNRWNYGRNLLLFAFISEIPWDLVHSGHIWGTSQNVLFTLFLSFLALCVVEQWEEGKINSKRFALSVFALIGFNIMLRSDYGSTGIGFVLLLYFLRHNHIYQAAAGCCFLGMRWITGLAFIPINLYNGKRGFIRGSVGKYLFYFFYPVHMFVIYLIKYFNLL